MSIHMLRHVITVCLLALVLATGARAGATSPGGPSGPEPVERNLPNVCLFGTALELEAAIRAGADVNMATDDGAIRLGKKDANPFDMLYVLSNRKAPYYFAVNKGVTPLMVAAGLKDLKKIRLLLDAGAQVNAVDAEGNTPLMASVFQEENPQATAMLIEAGADVGAVTVHGNSALLFACFFDASPDAVRLLLSVGSDVNLVNTSGASPLMAAAHSNSKARVTRLLLDAGASVNYVNGKGETALLDMAVVYPTEGNNTDRLAALDMLVKAGADVNAADKEGVTALMKAAPGHAAIIGLLAEAGAKIDAVNATGATPLMYAVERTWITEGAAQLVALGADVNAVDHDGDSALFRACWSPSHPAVIRQLLKMGADARHADANGYTALTLVAYDRMEPKDAVEIVQSLIAAGADINAAVRKRDGHTPLTWAIEGAGAEVVARLLAAGADVNAPQRGGDTPLVMAVRDGADLEIALMLLRAGAKYTKDALLKLAGERSEPDMLKAIRQELEKREASAAPSGGVR